MGGLALSPGRTFGFRPWVRRAGLSIVLVAAGVTAAILLWLAASETARFGWVAERFVWIYIGTLWLGGVKIWVGTFRPIAEADDETLTLRPIHQLRAKTIRWRDVTGTEQMIGGDRLIVYYETSRGMRFVALNLNLVKGRRDFLALVDERMQSLGFAEKIVERSRYMAR